MYVSYCCDGITKHSATCFYVISAGLKMKPPTLLKTGNEKDALLEFTQYFFHRNGLIVSPSAGIIS